jgi:glycosyltransferase involved in cell wall biosynthesis
MPLVMAGDSSFSPAYVERLKAMPGGDAVRFAGNVYGARLASLFRNAALFVLPSDLEGLPIVLLEALCYEVPVLASDIPPNREVMDGMCATFKAGDIRDLQEKLGRCLSSADSLKAGARLAASRVACRYEWDAVTDETVSVYARVSNR